MGNLLIVLGFLIICSAPLSVYASELFGRISTDPAANSGAVTTVPAAVSPVETAAQGGGATDYATPPVDANRPLAANAAPLPFSTEKTVEVLGQKIYPDDSLVRDEDGRIFLIQGRAKKPIRNMRELDKYRGQAILKADIADLNRYQTRAHLDGDLIRQKNDVRVYALKKGLKYHVLNLAELARYYFGLPIHNLEPEEMKNYE